MKHASLIVLVPLLALLSACKKESTSAPDSNEPRKLERGTPLEPGGTAPRSGERQLNRPSAHELRELRPGMSIPVGQEPNPGMASSGHAGNAEVEIMGQLRAKGIKAKQLYVYVSKSSCDLNAQNVESWGGTRIPWGEAQSFFLEIFVPQGSTGSICAAALDEAGKAVAQSQYGKNPVKMEGQGEVMFDKLDLELKPLAAPRALPKGL